MNEASIAAEHGYHELVCQEGRLERMYEAIQATLEVTQTLNAKPVIATCTVALHWMCQLHMLCSELLAL